MVHGSAGEQRLRNLRRVTACREATGHGLLRAAPSPLLRVDLSSPREGRSAATVVSDLFPDSTRYKTLVLYFSASLVEYPPVKTAHSFPLLPLVATLGCSLSAAAEGNAPLSASCSYAASAPATVSAPAKGTNEATAADPADDDLLPEDDADSPAEDGSSALPYFSPRPLPPIFDYWQEVLMEQSEARKYLVLDEDEYNRPLTEDEKAEIEEVRGHIREALAAAKELFTAQMALIRGPLSHPHYHPNDPYEVEDYLAICEEYLAESFHRDLEALSFCASFMSAGCVEPTLHPGRRPMLSMSEPEVIFRQRIGGESTVAHAWQLDQRAAEWQERQKRFMENYMEHYGDGSEGVGGESRDPFTGYCELMESGIPACAPDGSLSEKTVPYGEAMRELIRREERAWERYYTAMGELVCPSPGYRGSGTPAFTLEYQLYLLDTRERFLYLLASGDQIIKDLPSARQEKEAALLPLHRMYAYGEIFQDTALLFRHPKLAGNPWCISFPLAGPGFIYVKDNDVLRRYVAAHPEGGDVNIRGYQVLESRGEPYSSNKQEGSSDDDVPAPAADNALEMQQLFDLLECSPADGYIYG